MTYDHARLLFDQRMAALGRCPSFWRYRARKAWSAAVAIVRVQYALDAMAAFRAEIEQHRSVAIRKTQDQWGAARAEDGEVN